MQVLVENVGKFECKFMVKFFVECYELQVSVCIVEMGCMVCFKGFCFGKVLIIVIQQCFGVQVCGEVFLDLIGSILCEVFDKENLCLVVNLFIDIIGKLENGEIVYMVIFEVMLEFLMIDVFMFVIQCLVVEVFDVDIEKMIEMLCQQCCIFDVVDCVLKEGDFVMFEYVVQVGDYCFLVDGLECVGSVLGLGILFKVLDEVFIGCKVDELFEVDIDFLVDFCNE